MTSSSTPLRTMLKALYHYPDHLLSADEDREQFLVPWGFTIYRNFYGPGSDETWSQLLQTINAGVLSRLSKMQGGDDKALTTKVYNLFKLDTRSDPALDGLELDDLRQAYRSGTGGQPMNTSNDPWRLFLLADAQVLKDMSVIKVVQVDYDPVAEAQEKRRFAPQRFFGWITMHLDAVSDLWNMLDIYYLEEITESKTWGCPGALWNPDR